MNVKETDYGFLLVLDEGEKITQQVVQFCSEKKLRSGAITAIGGVKRIELGFYNEEKKDYEIKAFEHQLEVLNITGNIGVIEDKPIIHAHVSLGRKDFSTIGGHLVEGIVKPLLEVHIFKDENQIVRVIDERSKLKRISF